MQITPLTLPRAEHCRQSVQAFKVWLFIALEYSQKHNAFSRWHYVLSGHVERIARSLCIQMVLLI